MINTHIIKDLTSQKFKKNQKMKKLCKTKVLNKSSWIEII